MTNAMRGSVRAGGLGGALAIGLLVASLLPIGLVAVVRAAVAVPTPAIVNVSADTAVTGGSGVYTSMTGPVIAEDAAGQFGNGAIILTLPPSGFEFNPLSGSVTLNPGCTLTVSAVTMTTTTATVTIAGAPSVTTACTLTFAGLQVRPTAGAGPLPSGNITNTGDATTNAPKPGNYGTVTEVPGAPILTFSTSPVAPIAPLGGGSAFSVQPQVTSKDKFDNLRGGDVVTLAVKSGPGALTCNPATNQQSTGSSGPSLGIATFVGCSLDKAGTYVLKATTPGQTGTVPEVSLTIIVGTPARLAFTTWPAPTTTTSLGTVKVAIQDAGGNQTTDTRTITLTISASSGTFSCANNLSHAAVSGEAQFTGCTQTAIANGYTLTADDGAGGLSPVTSPSFNVTSGPASKLAVCWGTASTCNTTAPTGLTGGTVWPAASQPQVQIQDANGKIVTSDTTTVVTLSVSGTPTGGGTAVLACTGGNSKVAAQGIANFAGCVIDKAGMGYKLTASASGLTSATTTTFSVSVGPATTLVFTTQPAGATAGQAFTTQPVVAITDAGGNVVTSGVSANVALTIGANPGVPPGVLTCTPSQTVATATTVPNAGKAVFAGCRISTAGVGYTLVATASSIVPGTTTLQPATSNAFTVTAPPAEITLTPSASVITWGGTVVLTTRFLVNGADKTFILQGARDGVSWATIATLTTDANGTSSYPYRPATNLYYRVVFAGSGDLLAGTSTTTRVVVRQIALLRPTNSGGVKVVARGTKVTFTTTVRPARPELPAAKVSFYFYRKVSTGWALLARRDVYIDPLGRASWTWTFSTSGEWYVRSIATPTPFNANSVMSPVERYSVR